MRNPKTFIFYGISGSGKGTQAELLSKYLRKQMPDRDVLHVYPGKLLREFTKEIDTYTSNLTKQVMNKGGLLPGFIPMWAWTNFLIHNFTGKENLIFDGVARRQQEVYVLEEALKFYERESPFIVYLDVSDDWARDKLMRRGRKDDMKEDIDQRFEWFHKDAEPLMEHYKQSDYYRYLLINGEQSIEKVHEEIVEQIGDVDEGF